MKLFIKITFVFSIYLFSLKSNGQKIKIDIKSYKLGNSIKQNKSEFKFWVGTIDSTKNKLLILRHSENKDTLLYNDYIRDGVYEIYDGNNDGYQDFITSYHYFDLIHFFDAKTNQFKSKAISIPSKFDLLDSTNNIYWGYRDAQYDALYDYSILYKLKNYKPFYYYQIKYITPTGYSERKNVIKIKLYKFKNGNYDKPILVKEIKTTNPSSFDYKNYWEKHYKDLVE